VPLVSVGVQPKLKGVAENWELRLFNKNTALCKDDKSTYRV
jgi:hypothetical protein